MNDGVTRFASRYPVVWHVIEAEGAGDWLPKTGLLPTAELFRIAGVADDGANRDDFRTLPLGRGRIAVIRPQVMPDDRLRPTLAGLFRDQPNAWRRHINGHVFFWTEPRRRDAFLRACQRCRPHADAPVVLEFETTNLLGCHAGSVFWSRINTGSTVRGGAHTRRDGNTLQPIANYRSGPVAELAVRGRVTTAGRRP
ncbi:MAG TPA: hypothetical protein VL614_18730 [Acetobacteraceae bacterium]|nr:hypothetical protein [Acetobacteraceae bacterium]